MTKTTFCRGIALVSMSLMALTLSAVTVNAQEETERPKGMRARVKLLETEIDKLDETLKDVHGADTPDSLRTQLAAFQSKVDSLSMQLSELYQKTLSGESGGQEQDARLNDIAEEVSSLWKETEALKTLREEILKDPPAGYENGFFIGSKADKFRLTLNGFVRPYYAVSFQKAWDADDYGDLIYDSGGDPTGGETEVQDNGFGVANARLVVHTQILDVIHGEFEIDYGTLTGTVQYPVNLSQGLEDARYNRVEINDHSLRFLNIYGEYAPIPEFNIRLGQFKVPFDRESQIDANWLTFTTRSLMTRAYPRWGENVSDDSLARSWDYEMQRGSSFGRDTGLSLKGCVAEGIFNYEAGIFNGAGDNVTNDNRDMLIALRISTEPAGRMTETMSDLESSKSPLISIGAGFAYDLLDHKYMHNPADKHNYNSSDVNITADANFKWYGASVLAGVFYRHSDHGAVVQNEDAEDAPIDSMGIVAQVAYFIDNPGLEPAFRYSLYDADIDLKDNHVHEISAIFSYYPFVQNLKLQLQYRGLFPADTERSHFVPWGNWFDYYSEITLMAQVAF
ncbi:MAG: hypothetical protein GY847_36380 [Proteobacteria bacterium]|nr:hypothetical protein [Pseudomonadota bacterium]